MTFALHTEEEGCIVPKEDQECCRDKREENIEIYSSLHRKMVSLDLHDGIDRLEPGTSDQFLHQRPVW